jgi:hypothetical protein
MANRYEIDPVDISNFVIRYLFERKNDEWMITDLYNTVINQIAGQHADDIFIDEFSAWFFEDTNDIYVDEKSGNKTFHLEFMGGSIGSMKLVEILVNAENGHAYAIEEERV